MTGRSSKRPSLGPGYTAPALIAQKRDGSELAPEAIAWLVRAFVAGEVADYQMSAFAMAVLLRGMTTRETAALTLAMRDSGQRARLRNTREPKVDKHSTGGVGDKVSICLAPLVAACGARVPMISGRGLGHTGGTLDKLESIPGFRVDLSLARFQSIVAEHGFALIGQTPELAPADRKLYALRDVTATVESIPLITASILSKKLCEDLDALVLDVKVGRGAFMKTPKDARALARSIVGVGARAGLPTTAVLTRMDAPLGRAVGNALEAAEAFEVLRGGGPADLVECTLTLGSEMLLAAGVTRSRSRAEASLLRAMRSGEGARRLQAVITAQHGDARVVAEPDRLPRAKHFAELRSPRAGYVVDVDAMPVAQAALRLGAGRTRADQAIDPGAGIVLRKKPGERVRSGEALAEIHARDRADADAVSGLLRGAFTVAAKAKRPVPLVIETLRPERCQP